ncbi:single-stranded-DNA-specific exonuclease RecJ [Sulfuriferula sp. AH1]|uniref:single-stranded-DNA-specific exonuclease RecJ n=1 Tax=Sulfuriferula sp. AH1 TaxID=1985873 RepID=UPI000B3B7332|nr:single-stranded-DNA-specific exonuclease RecJ [Sulfuriferula sp. AH1]ARU31191.1 single-stranded-DNA-specific exonuclease RecJ [Sulfuriferula sp. AH1]
MSEANIVVREFPAEHAQQLSAAGVHPVLARIYAARGIQQADQLDTGLSGLLHFGTMKNILAMAARLADAVDRQQRILVVADYDADGATACTVAVRGLRLLGLTAEFLVPNRFEYGYGLTPEIVQLAAQQHPDIIVTVDNGIASIAGVQAAQALGIEVLVTDHHLPGDSLPDALIVNPNQPDCPFPSKHLAGVGVMFYVLLALRVELQARGAFADRVAPNLAVLLDIVALGTVADVVRLDDNNRILVEQGLRRMRQGRACAGIRALFNAAARPIATATAADLGFMIGPRLNAAGRLEDMSLGIACLLSEDDAAAEIMAQRLHALNAERRSIEADMQAQALASLEHITTTESYSLAMFDPDWHQGVIGILASRLKDKFHRPVICFARGNNGEIKGSGRSIGPLHLRDALDIVSKRAPNLILKFGGHAAAAGLSIRETDFAEFVSLFEQTVQGLLSPADLARTIPTDGSLAPNELNVELAQVIHAQVWGQGFPAPSFDGEFRVAQQRILKDRHLKLQLESGGRRFDSILFNRTELLPAVIHAVYQPELNHYNGQIRLQIKLEHWRRG